MLKRVLAIVVIIFILLAGGYYYYQTNQDNKSQKTTNTQETNNISVTLKITNDTKISSYNLKVKKDSTVLAVMDEAKNQGKIEYSSSTSSYGTLIESINNIKNDATTNKYWSYYINNQMASQGVSAQKVKSNDLIEWKYQSF